MRINEFILKVYKYFVINHLIMHVIVCCDFVVIKNIKSKVDYKEIKAVNINERMKKKKHLHKSN